MSSPSRRFKRALLLIDHGSRAKAANQVLGTMADTLRRSGRFDVVCPAHMDLGSPTIAEGIGRCLQAGVDELIVMPYFLVPGLHAAEDIPRMVLEALPGDSKAQVRFAKPLGTHEGLIQAVICRAEEASALDRPQAAQAPWALLDKEDCFLLIVDIQEAFAGKLFNGPLMMAAAQYLIRCARQLGVPVVVTEQYPKGLGATCAAIASEFPEEVKIVEKIDFNAFNDSEFRSALPPGRRSALICGIETHICLAQTAAGAIENGFKAVIPADATGARYESDHQFGLRRMEMAGAIISTVEMAVFELLRRAGTQDFKKIHPVLKAGWRKQAE